jgi:membrane carboxypeptidase/penicillin-binding protein
MAATIAVPAWARFMRDATSGDRAEWYKVPPGFEKVAICQTSGMRATTACRLAAANHQGAVVDDYFPTGTSPKEPCSVHVEQLSLPGEVDQPAIVGVTPLPLP